ncbi:MAG: hypothetical protein JWQ38_1508 [Flavipsychrobacter sp.]|nr:hypothetical protein [Flavipsychrobacter sp.]
MRNRRFDHRDFKDFGEQRQRSRVLFGVMLALVGIGLMLRTMGLLPHFTFDFSWPFILIFIGVFSGIKHRFRNNGWWIAILIGIANLTPQFMIMGQPSSHFVWPAFIILIGLAIAFRPRRPKCQPNTAGGVNSHINTDSNLNVDITFGGRKEIVTSKDFKGGMVNVTFAGCEINLAQADMTEPSVVMDFRISFGGVEVIVPSHWEVQNEINPSFGSVEDGRTIQTATTIENKKVLILRGSCSFGSIELKSY